MADCLISPVKEIGKCIWDSFLKPHVDYWWCFDSNIQGLKNGIRDLEGKIFDIKARIEAARLHLEVVRPAVEEWLNASTHKLEEARKILLPDDNIPKAWKLISRYSLGKNAKEIADKIAELRNNGNFDMIADPAPPPAMASPSHGSTTDFESRKGIEEDIIKFLKESSVDVIGICGMGGVGKTTMAQIIWKRVKDENLFHEVVMVTVSQKIDMLKIQDEIAEWLKLKLDEKHMAIRAAKLRTRLMDTKKKLVILDDVWESLEFQDLGIPIDNNFERCKVLLTSRSRDTWKTIKNKKVFELKILKEKEAWILFKEKAGECVENSALLSVAKDVVQECKGLPIALVTVGVILQDEMDIHTWENSLSQLKKSNPADLPKFIEKVYQPLKLSFDNLDTHVDQCFFLLCSLFPEDYHIPVEQLTWYSMGLQMFGDISGIKEATIKAHTLVGKLKRRFLLIDGSDKLHVKMHDVIRDVAIYILKSLTSIKNSSDVNCNWMSVDISNERMEVPLLSRFPKLQLLMWSSKAFYDISHLSFEGMEDLKVLSFEDISIGSLPPTLGSLKNLQTLRLVKCNVKNISVIGKLTCLKILSCYGCANITELPAEIRSLSGLRLLELSRCYDLQRIPFGVISSLGRLEELKMRRSFSRWEAEENGKERRNASLTELGSLLNLTCLEIEIDDCTLSAQEICLSQKLVKYRILIGSIYYHVQVGDCEKVMILNLKGAVGAVGNWIRLLARNAEFLSLRGVGSENINVAETENLKNLELWNCSTGKKLVETKDCKPNIVFHLLETLILDGLSNLEEICDRNQNVSLCNLKSINIGQCYYLRSLFSVARKCLSQLEVLEIRNCATMEQVFWNEVREDNTDGCIEFPKLKKLTLHDLPNLTALCKGLENNIINFPNLTEMSIENLPSLKYGVFPLSPEILCNLKSIKIESFSNLRHLFPVSLARTSLSQLEVLEIRFCHAMERVFWYEINEDTDGCIEFPKLQQLKLYDLRNLTALCEGLENIIIKFPNLTELNIKDSSKLNSLSPLKSETLVCHEDNTLIHCVCNPKVEIGRLVDLRLCNLGDNIRNIWCHQISFNFFNNLERLEIMFMNGIGSLMSTLIAKNLMSLKYLEIMRCEKMVEVIERDDNDKQVVDINCLFPTLRILKISSMLELRRFWQWNHTLELPLLEEVVIYNCPAMETFTLGTINIPNIRKMNINFKNIYDQKDLNAVIRHIWTQRSSDLVLSSLR